MSQRRNEDVVFVAACVFCGGGDFGTDVCIGAKITEHPHFFESVLAPGAPVRERDLGNEAKNK